MAADTDISTSTTTGMTSGDLSIMSSAITNALSTLVGSYNQRQQASMDAKIAANNAQIFQENIKTTRQEHAINAYILRYDARSKISSSKAAMAASGNIGSSADAGVVQAYKNLDMSLSNMRFNYETRETELQNKYNQAKYQEKMAKKAKKKSGLSMVLGTVGSVVGAVAGTVIGGPIGGAVGASIGGSLGNAGGQMFG